jgi:serine/threonine protein kinase
MNYNDKKNVFRLKPGVVRKVFPVKNALKILKELPQYVKGKPIPVDSSAYTDYVQQYLTNYVILTKLKNNPYIIKMISNDETDKLVIDTEEMQMTLEEWRDKYIRTNVYQNNFYHIALWSTLGLKAIHDSGWVHNDMHLKNILVNVDDVGNITELKIIDFDLAKPWNETKPYELQVEILRYLKSMKQFDYELFDMLINQTEEQEIPIDWKSMMNPSDLEEIMTDVILEKIEMRYKKTKVVEEEGNPLCNII